MAATLIVSAAALKAACDAFVDLLDAGSSDATGDLLITTSGDVQVALLTLSNPAFGNATTASPSVATASAITSDSSAAGGTAAKGKLRNRDNTVVFDGNVATSSASFVISSTTVGVGDTVSCSSLTFTLTSPN